MLNHCPRDYRAVLLQLENHVEREIHARSRRKIPMECDRINSGIKHAEIAVPGRMRDPRSRRRAVLIEQQRIARRPRGSGYGISGKKFRRSCRPRCARGTRRTRCARRYGNLWEYMSLFRLSEVVEMFVADKFVIYMYVAGVCLTVLFSDSNKVYQLDTHLPRQRLTSSILF